MNRHAGHDRHAADGGGDVCVSVGSSADKRAKIDELLERPGYAAWWATKFCDWTK